MAASERTIRDVAGILVEELGLPAARKLVRRIARDTSGNASYEATVCALLVYLDNWRWTQGHD